MTLKLPLSSYSEIREWLRFALLYVPVILVAACGGGGSGTDNGRPTASNSVLSTKEDIPTAGKLFASDPESDPLTFEIVVNAALGVATITDTATGDFSFQPNLDQNGTDSFTFRACDASACSDIKTVSISITAVDDSPRAADDSGSTLEDTAFTISVLANDADPDVGSILSVQSITQAGSGSVVTDGTDVTYTPDPDFNGTDNFTYTVRDETGLTDIATVTVAVNPVNDPPTASNSCETIIDDSPPTPVTPLNITLTAHDLADGDGDIVSYTIVALPINGQVNSCSAVPCDVGVSPVVTYTPSTNSTGRRGMDKFSFIATDAGGLDTPVATVWILNDGKVRIMPLGDSITEGANAANLPAVGERTSYRRKLFSDLDSLANGSYTVDFVGQRQEGSLASPPIGDEDHQGTPGWRDDQIAAEVQGYLNVTPADIVLLHIGTNNFNTSASDVQTILNNIDTWEISNHPVTVFLARIIDDVANYGTDLDVTTFNDNVELMVEGRFAGERVIMVDMEVGAGLVYGDGAPGADMADNLHPKDDPTEEDPNPIGYAKMANKWYTDMTNPANVGAKFLGLPQCQ